MTAEEKKFPEDTTETEITTAEKIERKEEKENPEHSMLKKEKIIPEGKENL